MPTIKQQYFSDWGRKAFNEGVEQGLQQGLQQGREEARSAGQAHALLTILRSRGLAVSRSVARRIEAERDPARLDAWIARAVSAASIEDVFADE